MISAKEALDRLNEGNQRFVSGAGQLESLGELFVIRVAGNVVAPSQIGSVEYAAECFGTPLVVVLGHTQCGAVQVTLDELRQPTGNQSHNLRSIVDRIRPSVEGLLEPDIEQAIRSNVRVSADNLSHGSAIIEQLVEDGKLLIVGAEYSLETGIVDFFYNVPPPDR